MRIRHELNRTSALFIAVLALSGASGCGGSIVATAAYADAVDAPTDSVLFDLMPDKRIVLHAPADSCAVTRGATLAEVTGGGVAVAGTKEAAKARLLQITGSVVHTHEGWVALSVSGDGESFWLRVPGGKPLGCVFAAPAGVDAIAARKGSSVVFAPWKPTCDHVVAAGASPSAILAQSDAGTPLPIDGFSVGAATASGYAAGEPGGSLWVGLGNGALSVRADSLDACFSQVGSPEAQPPSDVASLLHLAPERCKRSDEDGREHVECRTTLGLWEGLVAPNALDLRLVKRSLGRVHFLDGHLVDGARYADAVVSVTQGEPSDPRARALYSVLDESVIDAIKREASGTVRIAPNGSPDVTYRVHVEVAGLQIGELETREVTETTQYKVRDEIRDNPDKPRARERMDLARQRLSDEEASYQQEYQAWEQAKQLAIDECNRQAQSVQDETNRQWAQTGCDVASIAGQFVQPSQSGVEAARTELTDAEVAYASTPDTLTVPIMADWNYQKRVYSRSTSATLRLAMGNAGEAAGEITVPLSHAWTDYEVQGDAAHGVQAHSAEPGPIKDKEALVPFIAQQASRELAVRLKAAISAAATEAAKKAFLAAGHEPSKPGFEGVDAIAYEVSEGRMSSAQVRGHSDLQSKAVIALPTQAIVLQPDECVLAVAVADGQQATDLALATPDKTHADLRGGSMAFVEACRSELGAQASLPLIELSSAAGGAAKWGIYRTRVGGAPKIPAASSATASAASPTTSPHAASTLQPGKAAPVSPGGSP